nr:hypothetical protein [uncultured Gemmiger sp.]
MKLSEVREQREKQIKNMKLREAYELQKEQIITPSELLSIVTQMHTAEYQCFLMEYKLLMAVDNIEKLLSKMAVEKSVSDEILSILDEELWKLKNIPGAVESELKEMKENILSLGQSEDIVEE